MACSSFQFKAVAGYFFIIHWPFGLNLYFLFNSGMIYIFYCELPVSHCMTMIVAILTVNNKGRFRQRKRIESFIYNFGLTTDVRVSTIVVGGLSTYIDRLYHQIRYWIESNAVHQSLPAFNLCVLPFIFRYRGLSEVCFTSEFKAHFYWAEKVWAAFITVFQGSNNVSRACQGFEELNLLERICHCVTALKSVAVAEQDLDTLVIIPFSCEDNRAAVYLKTAHTREWACSSVDELSGLVVLTPL